MTLRLPVAVLTSSLLLAAGCTRPGFPAYADGVREFAYVANSAGNTVTILDLVYLRPDRTIPVGVDPVALAVNPVRNEVYVVNAQPEQAAGSVSVIDTVKNAVVATIPVRRNPTAIAVDAAGLRAFVVNTGSNAISVVDLERAPRHRDGSSGRQAGCRGISGGRADADRHQPRQRQHQSV